MTTPKQGGSRPPIKSTISERTEKVITIDIDGNSYEIRKLKLGASMKLARVLGVILKGTKVDLNTMISSTDSQAMPIVLDIGDIVDNFSTEVIELLAIGLNVESKIVENFEDQEASFKALEKILTVNPIGKLLGKSTALLGTIMSS